MAQPIKIESSIEGRLFQTLGSFWTSVFRDRDKVRVLLETDLRTNIFGQFNQAVQNYAGDARLAALTRHVFVPFEQNDIIETGMQVYDMLAPQFEFGLSVDGKTTYGDYRIRYWALPLQDVLPVAIQARDRQLLVGVDFFIQSNRYIFFRQDPRLLFPPSSYLVVRGYERVNRPYISFFTQTETPGYDDLVTQYFRRLQTPQYFRLALASVAGLGIIRRGGELLSITPTYNNTGEVIYCFPTESVRVNYAHDSLVVGQKYDPLTVIGDVIQVVQADRKQNAWWRQINWRGGLTLDPLIPGARSLPLPDVWTVAYNAGQDPGSSDGSKVHAQLRLSNDFYAEKVYWDRVRLDETRTGFYLNNVIGLGNETPDENPTTPDTYEKLLLATQATNDLNFQLGIPLEQPDVGALPQTKQVNALDVFFQAVLGDVGLVIAFDQNQMARQKEVFDFLSREMPVGGCPIIIGFVHNIIDDYDSFDSEVVVKETVSTSLGNLVQVTEDVPGSYFEGETVSVMPQAPIP
jgi:hypothetical protein